MERIFVLFTLLVTPIFAYSADATIIGGFFSDYDQWKSGYFVTVSHIDGDHIKGAYIKSQNQKIIIPEGFHKIKISCAFLVEPKKMLVGEKEVALNIKGGHTYKLAAIINFNRQEPNRKYRYCEPLIDEVKS